MSRSKGVLVPKADMPVAKTSFGCYVHSASGSIYVVGGRDVSKSATAKCELYNFLNDEWTQLPELPKAAYSLSCLFNPQKETLYAFGGFDRTDSLLSSISRL